MDSNSAVAVRYAMAKVRKGDVRNTVLRQIHDLEAGIKALSEAIEIKSEEQHIFHRRNPTKAQVLNTQVEIMTDGRAHMRQALSELKKYKKYTMSRERSSADRPA